MSRRFAAEYLLTALSAALVVNSSCKDASQKEKESAPPSPTEKSPVSATEVSTNSSTLADAGAEPRNWQCAAVATTPRAGRFGDAPSKKKREKHAGIEGLVLRATPDEELHLAVLAKDDINNDLGLNVSALSPPRAVQAYRYRGKSWEDLGRPFQLIGWRVTLEGSASDGPRAYAVSTGIGDVRRALVASCESGTWTLQNRFMGKVFEAAALVTAKSPDSIDNISILRGLYAEVGKDCKKPRLLGGGRVPVSVQLPPSLASDRSRASTAFAMPDDCRLPRKFLAEQRGKSVMVSYEQCAAINGGDHVQIANCQFTTLWFHDDEWQRMPSFEKLRGEVSELRAAIALTESGPLVAVAGSEGLGVYKASSEGWQALPALPGKGCQRPVALRGDPVRLIVQSCATFGKVSAFRLEGEAWQRVGGPIPARPQWGAQERPLLVADWVGDSPYIALGYQGAPVVRVFEGVGSKWQQILEAVVDPKSPKSRAPSAQD